MHQTGKAEDGWSSAYLGSINGSVTSERALQEVVKPAHPLQP
jgi:hypothetical protein